MIKIVSHTRYLVDIFSAMYDMRINHFKASGDSYYFNFPVCLCKEQYNHFCMSTRDMHFIKLNHRLYKHFILKDSVEPRWNQVFDRWDVAKSYTLLHQLSINLMDSFVSLICIDFGESRYLSLLVALELKIQHITDNNRLCSKCIVSLVGRICMASTYFTADPLACMTRICT